MIDLPNSRDMVGPEQIRAIQRDIEWIKDWMRANEIQGTPTVRVTKTSVGTVLEASPGVSSQSSTGKSVWRP